MSKAFTTNTAIKNHISCAAGFILAYRISVLRSYTSITFYFKQMHTALLLCTNHNHIYAPTNFIIAEQDFSVLANFTQFKEIQEFVVDFSLIRDIYFDKYASRDNSL